MISFLGKKKTVQPKINHIWVKLGTTFSPASTIIPQLRNHICFVLQYTVSVSLFPWPFPQSVAIPQTASVCPRLSFSIISVLFLPQLIYYNLDNYSSLHPPAWCITIFELTLADLQVQIGPKRWAQCFPHHTCCTWRAKNCAHAPRTEAVNLHKLQLKILVSAGPSTSDSVKHYARI